MCVIVKSTRIRPGDFLSVSVVRLSRKQALSITIRYHGMHKNTTKNKRWEGSSGDTWKVYDNVILYAEIVMRA